MMNAREWVKKSFLEAESDRPFSFIYGGKKSGELLKTWSPSTETRKLDDARTRHGVTFKDARTGLEVACDVTEYADFPAVEWVVRFTNRRAKDTPILEAIHALDTSFGRTGDSEFMLRHMRGSSCTKSDFAPLEENLYCAASRRLFCIGGRSSNGGDATRSDGSFPFFDVAFDGGGITFAVGWSGQWAAQFKRDKEKGLTVVAGMEHSHLKLRPGEEIRTPRILMFFWEGALEDAHNHFRRFILRHHTPLKDGNPAMSPLAANMWFKYNSGNDVTEENQIAEVRAFAEAGIELESYWIDAGWYEGVGNWAFDVGNWFPKKRAFPRGLKPVAEEARKHGLGFVLWLEPERVYPDTWLWKEHPEWLLIPSEEVARERQRYIPQVEALLDLGNPQARQWLTDHISSMIEEIGITVYRHDFNFDPLPYWRAADAPNRQGITQIRHIEGLYAFWDELLGRHPGLVIDNCASGGRRLDLETISRSVALWRSDYALMPEGDQCQTLAVNRYLPCTSLGTKAADPYTFRSSLACGLAICPGLPTAGVMDTAELRERVREFKMLRLLFYGDFYPLTSHSIESDAWCAYQFDRKDINLGAAFFFRREQSPFPVGQFKLHGLEPSAKYELTDIDSGKKQEVTGRKLMKTGIEVKMSKAPCSTILVYSRASS